MGTDPTVSRENFADRNRATFGEPPSNDPWCSDHGQPAATCTDCRRTEENSVGKVFVEIGQDIVRLHLKYVLRLISDQEKERTDFMDNGKADEELYDLREFLADLLPEEVVPPSYGLTGSGELVDGVLDVGSNTRTPLPETNFALAQGKEVWIVKGQVTDVDAHYGMAELGDVEWQFSDGPPGQRGSSNDYVDLTKGLREHDGYVIHFVDDRTLEDRLADFKRSYPSTAFVKMVDWLHETGNLGEFLDHVEGTRKL